MEFKTQILFFFSALGAFNGFLLSAYFAFLIKHRTKATYFLSALILMLSIRVAKSVFLIYVPGVSSLFIEIGLSACALIGPFLYLYIGSTKAPDRYRNWKWLIHILPVIIIMIATCYWYPYKEYRALWQRHSGYFIWIIYLQWGIYTLLSGWQIKESFRKLLSHKEKLNDLDFWLINVVGGISIIWMAYTAVGYFSYIVGALSFSFIIYLMLVVWGFKRRKSLVFFEQGVKYANKKISPEESATIAAKLETFFREEEPYRNPDFKLPELADKLKIAPSYLSQYLNDNLQKNFPTLINEQRVDAAEKMLKENQLLTIEAIGTECGFKSNSAFYTAFKKYKGITPGKFKKSIEE